MIIASDVVEILGRLRRSGVDVWLDGGWGVDALLGEQTRPHEDLDLIVRVGEVLEVIDRLGNAGFQLAQGEPTSNFVLRDERMREIDVHPVAFGDSGDGIYLMADGDDRVYPASGFLGTGSVRGQRVRCLTAEVQVLCHAQGHEPTETDFHDMRLLHERLGTELLPPYSDQRPAR
ncbi:MAG: nucleotidyltransferase domain-containing protein [Actinomycetota bacterium]